MKIKKDFVLREVAGDTLLIPTGQTTLDINGMICLNEMGAEIWKLLPEVEDEEALIARLLDEYDVQEAILREDVRAFLDKLCQVGVL